ncbi:MAG: carotenoid biosynthesis protein [Candidatus Rokubacteria bacterium]|nr:carotenoid biosynthesis protein [Candidatus Rokubacteria bacterium]
MELLIGTVVLRPYVFGFLAAFLIVGARDLGARRTLVFGACVWPLAWLAEFSSTRIGVPFGLYHYTEATRGQELYLANVPFMDSLSFTFLAYAAFCLARAALGGRRISRPALALFAGALMMALDVVIDPLAVRGDRWFLGRIFYYPDGGVYFGVPLSNFVGWVVVGACGVGSYLAVVGDTSGREARGGVALYYAVAVFNLVVTMWIGEWLLAAVGLALHVALALSLRALNQSVEVAVGFGRGAESL